MAFHCTIAFGLHCCCQYTLWRKLHRGIQSCGPYCCTAAHLQASCLQATDWLWSLPVAMPPTPPQPALARTITHALLLPCCPPFRLPADNINVSHGQTAGMIDSLFTGDRLGHSADIAGGLLASRTTPVGLLGSSLCEAAACATRPTLPVRRIVLLPALACFCPQQPSARLCPCTAASVAGCLNSYALSPIGPLQTAACGRTNSERTITSWGTTISRRGEHSRPQHAQHSTAWQKEQRVLRSGRALLALGCTVCGGSGGPL